MTLSNAELFSLFNKAAEDTRWIGSATDEEWMAITTYVIQRSQGQVPK